MPTEALILRAAARKRIEQPKQRLVQSAQVQEGDEPAERPVRLLREFEQTADDLAR